MTLQEDLDQVSDRVANLEMELNRNNENVVDNVRRAVKACILGSALGYSIAKIIIYINGGSENNQR